MNKEERKAAVVAIREAIETAVANVLDKYSSQQLPITVGEFMEYNDVTVVALQSVTIKHLVMMCGFYNDTKLGDEHIKYFTEQFEAATKDMPTLNKTSTEFIQGLVTRETMH